ncbi:MAG TPA: DegT/DnrJ/EryC1/StrS family aminotransferase [Burkholderiales bacterium]|jgi:dTDP-4-amino-4,6-dideoxygalactose transaminase
MSKAISIPMADPAGEYRLLKDEIDAAVGRVLASGRYVLGPEGEALEREVAAYVGARHAVGCNSGTDALHLPLVAAGVGPGDEVVVPAFTFFATAEAVSYTGATPVFADIDPATFNLSVQSLAEKVTPKTRAVIAVHLFGQCAELDRIAELCRSRGLLLIEDCAQALGAEYQGRRAGSWGDFGCFSFYPTKNLAAAGDAGMITTSEKKHEETLRMLRHHGSRQTYLHERVGWNSRLDEIQAAVLRVKLRRLDEFNAVRRRVAQRYRQKLKGVQAPAEDARGRHAYHQFTVRSGRRDAIRETLARDGIAASIFYPTPLHRQPAYEPAQRGTSLPASEAAAQTVLSLPIHPLLDDASVDRVCARVEAALA